jgi:hypothetical protein
VRTEDVDRELDGEARVVLGAAPDAVEPLAHATRTSVTRRVCRVRTRTGDAVVKVISSGRDDPGWSGSNEPMLAFNARLAAEARALAAELGM